MRKYKDVVVGDRYVTKSGVELVVVRVLECQNAEVQDSEGNSRIVKFGQLRSGDVKWLKKDGSFKGNSKAKGKPISENISNGKFREFLNRFPIGSVWPSNRYGDFEIVSVRSSKDITIKWLSTGAVQSNVTADGIRSRKVVDKTIVKPMIPRKHYVYIVTVNGTVVYVGKGYGDRYLHTISGCSGNKELNRLYFAKAAMITEIYRDDMTDEEARLLERELISQLRPSCNQIIYKPVN